MKNIKKLASLALLGMTAALSAQPTQSHQITADHGTNYYVPGCQGGDGPSRINRLKNHSGQVKR